MRSLRADAALVAVPALAGIAMAAGFGHILLTGIAKIQGGEWFALSMFFLPLYFILAMALAGWAFGWTEDHLEHGRASVRAGRTNAAVIGGTAAIVALAYQPSLFVAIAASTAGAAYLLHVRMTGEATELAQRLREAEAWEASERAQPVRGSDSAPGTSP